MEKETVKTGLNSSIEDPDYILDFYKSSDQYLSHLNDYRIEGHYEVYLDYLRRCMQPSDRFLDLGCGTGYSSYLISKEGFSTVGFDISYKFISTSNHLKNDRLRFVVGNGSTLPFRDNSFDVIGMYDVIEHVPDIENLLGEITRILKVNGRLVIIAPNILSPFSPIRALLSSGGRRGIYNNRKEAFISIFRNTFLIAKKVLSKKIDFSYRTPRIYSDWSKSEDEACYCANPAELKKYLVSHGFKIDRFQKDGPNLLHKLIGILLPDFASSVYIVARKRKIKNKVLFISYNGVMEQIMHSQGLPYLRELSKKGFCFTLLSFERRKDITKEKIKEYKDMLKRWGIDWHWLVYHKNPSLPATLFDIIVGSIYIFFLVIGKRIDILHARSVIPAAMTYPVCKLLGVRLLYDMRGLLAEEYAGGGAWREGELKFRLVKMAESLCLRIASAVVVLTDRHKALVEELSYIRKRGIKTEVIPCCVDLSRFTDNNAGRGPKEDLTFMYLGKLGTHYMLDKMMDYFSVAQRRFPEARFMILTQNEPGLAWEAAQERNIDKDKIIIKNPDFAEIPALVSKADVGLFFINPYKKLGSSPIKLGEFLACGVPVVINNGVGDTDSIVKSNRVGTVIKEFTEENYVSSIDELISLMKEGKALKTRCRNTAERLLSLELGVRKYEDIYQGLDKV